MERAATYTKELWLSTANVQVILWPDNSKKQRYGPNDVHPEKTSDNIAVAILHTTKLPHFQGQPNFRDLLERVPDVAGALVLEATMCDQVRRPFTRVPLDVARRNVRGVMWRPFMLSPLCVGQQLELLKGGKMLELVEIQARRGLPLLIDMKVHYYLCKMMHAHPYRRWEVAQLLPSHPLVYRVRGTGASML